jgi:hypothetical protein
MQIGRAVPMVAVFKNALTFIPVCEENGKRLRSALTLARLTDVSKMMPNAHGDALDS